MSALWRNVRCCHSQKKKLSRPRNDRNTAPAADAPRRIPTGDAAVRLALAAVIRHPDIRTQTLWPTRTRFTDTIQGGNHSHRVSPYRVAAGCCPRLAGRGGAADGGCFPPLLLRLQQTRWRPPLCPLRGSAGCWWEGDGRTLSPAPVWRKVTG